MTPEQSEIIFEEYVAMNSVDDNDRNATTVPVSEFAQPKQGTPSTAGGNDDLGRRLRDELNRKLGKT